VGWNNPHKYFYYNDPFIGIVDCYVKEGLNAKYARYAEMLEKLSNHAKFGYVFETAAALCRVLEYKCELGVKTRKAYQSGDKAALRKLAENDYAIVAQRIEEMYYCFKSQWDRENKSFGFEPQEIRFGGMMYRIKMCAKRLLDYVDGKIKKIPELEEKTLDFLGGVDRFDENQTQIHDIKRMFSPSGFI